MIREMILTSTLLTSLHIDSNMHLYINQHMVYMSQVLYKNIQDIYQDFRHKTLTTRLIKQGYIYSRLCLTFKKFSKIFLQITPSLFSKFQT